MKNFQSFFAVAGCFLLLVIGCGKIEKTSKTPTNKPVAETETPTEIPAYELTLEKFNRLKTGMTYEQAVEILNAEGTVISESEIDGTKTVTYQWTQVGVNVVSINLMFQNGKLISKSQFGL